jgi:hypothetical protein
VDAAAWQQAKRLIEEALSRPAADRRAFLESSCRDAALRHEVEAMLETYETYPFVVEQHRTRKSNRRSLRLPHRPPRSRLPRSNPLPDSRVRFDLQETTHVEGDVKQAATVIAAVLYQLAMRDEMVPRFTGADMPPLPTRTSSSQ